MFFFFAVVVYIERRGRGPRMMADGDHYSFLPAPPLCYDDVMVVAAYSYRRKDLVLRRRKTDDDDGREPCCVQKIIVRSSRRPCSSRNRPRPQN